MIVSEENLQLMATGLIEALQKVSGKMITEITQTPGGKFGDDFIYKVRGATFDLNKELEKYPFPKVTVKLSLNERRKMMGLQEYYNDPRPLNQIKEELESHIERDLTKINLIGVSLSKDINHYLTHRQNRKKGDSGIVSLSIPVVPLEGTKIQYHGILITINVTSK